MNAIKILSNNDYCIFNKTVAKKCGRDAAILLGELCSEYNYWASVNQLKDGWFYSTVENVEENTTLSKYEQGKAIDKLIEMGWLEKQLKGLPAKRYFKINESKIVSFLVAGDEFDITSQKTVQQPVKGFDSNNNKKEINNDNDKDISNSSEFDNTSSDFKNLEEAKTTIPHFKEPVLDNLSGRQADTAPWCDDFDGLIVDEPKKTIVWH